MAGSVSLIAGKFALDPKSAKCPFELELDLARQFADLIDFFRFQLRSRLIKRTAVRHYRFANHKRSVVRRDKATFISATGGRG